MSMVLEEKKKGSQYSFLLNQHQFSGVGFVVINAYKITLS